MVRDIVLSRLMHTVKDTIPLTWRLRLFTQRSGCWKSYFSYSLWGLCGLGLHPSLSSPTRPHLSPDLCLTHHFYPCTGFRPIFYCKHGSGYSTVSPPETTEYPLVLIVGYVILYGVLFTVAFLGNIMQLHNGASNLL